MKSMMYETSANNIFTYYPIRSSVAKEILIGGQI